MAVSCGQAATTSRACGGDAFPSCLVCCGGVCPVVALLQPFLAAAPTPGGSPPALRGPRAGACSRTVVRGSRPAPTNPGFAALARAADLTRTVLGRMRAAVPVCCPHSLAAPRFSEAWRGPGRATRRWALFSARGSAKSLVSLGRRRFALAAHSRLAHRSSPFNDEAYADRFDPRGRNPRGGSGR